MTQTRADRLHAVVIALFESGAPMSFLEISRAAGLKKTPYFKDKILDQLERDGYVTRALDESSYPKRFLYQLTENGRTLYNRIVGM